MYKCTLWVITTIFVYECKSFRCPWFGLVWFGFGFCFLPTDRDSFYRIRANHNFQSFVLALFCVGSSDVVAVVVPSSLSSSFEFAHPPLAFAHCLEITVLISLHTAISVHYLVHSNGTNFVCFVCAAWELKFFFVRNQVAVFCINISTQQRNQRKLTPKLLRFELLWSACASIYNFNFELHFILLCLPLSTFVLRQSLLVVPYSRIHSTDKEMNSCDQRK